jgi:hypothetical protein
LEVKNMTTLEKAHAEKIVENIPIGEIKDALINEYRRRLIRYKMIDEAMRKKYGMSFSDFESANMVRKKKFSWDVESDSMEWEHALEGVRYVEQKLKYIEGL